MTHDKIEVVLKIKTSVYTGGLFEDPGPGLVPTDPKDWAPGSDPGYTMPSAEAQMRALVGEKLQRTHKPGFWEWVWGLPNDVTTLTVTEIISVKTDSQDYISGE